MNTFMEQNYSTNVRVRYRDTLTAVNHCTTGSESSSSQGPVLENPRTEQFSD